MIAQDPSHDDLSLSSARDPRAASPDASSAGKPRTSPDFDDFIVTPDAAVTWAQDVFGNAVATATFRAMAHRLLIDSRAEIELGAMAWPVFDVVASAIFYPFKYADDEWTDLGALTVRQYPDPDWWLHGWARAFVRGNPTDTLSLLKDLCAGVANSIATRVGRRRVPNRRRTLDRGWGSCRDFAVLFVEAARSLGFGARIVSGYLYNSGPDMSEPERRIDPCLGRSFRAGRRLDYLRSHQPQCRQFELDPSRRGARHLAAMPVTGSFGGRPDAFQGMSVEVQVTA